MIRVKNWDKFQHYKNRKPPWIRLYRDLLNDPDFFALSGDATKTLIMIWLIASEDKNLNGELPAIDVLAFRMRIDSDKMKRLLIELNQWVEIDDSDMLADCMQLATPDQIRSEGETDQIRDRSDQRQNTRKRVTYTKEFEEFRSQYPTHRIGGKQQDWKSWKVAERSGMTVDIAVEYLAKWKQCQRWTSDGGQYIVALSKWLRDGYWETEPPAAHGPYRPLTRAEEQHRRNLEVLQRDAERDKS